MFVDEKKISKFNLYYNNVETPPHYNYLTINPNFNTNKKKSNQVSSNLRYELHPY